MIIACCVFVFLWSCEDDIEKLDTESEQALLTEEEATSLLLLKESNTISFEEAAKEAMEFASYLDEIDPQVNGRMRHRNIQNSQRVTIKGFSETVNGRVSEVDSLTIAYVFNFSGSNTEENGYVVMSGDERVPGIYTYAFEGAVGDTVYDPGLSFFFGNLEGFVRTEIEKFNQYYDSILTDAVAKLVASLPDSVLDELDTTGNGRLKLNEPCLSLARMKNTEDERCLSIYTTTSTHYSSWSTIENKGPFINVRWNQGDDWDPYNDSAYVNDYIYYMTGEKRLCSNGRYIPVGCGPVAVAQIASFHEHPNAMDGITYNWNGLTSQPRVNWSANPDLRSQVACLMRSVGERVKVSWECDGGSGTDRDDINQGMKAMGYNISSKHSYNSNSIKNNLRNEQIPVLIAGYSFRERKGLWPFRRWDHSRGHYFVIDGYKKRKRTKTTTVRTYDSYSRLLSTITYRSTEYNEFWHCNMGWGESSSTTWYVPGVFDTKNPPSNARITKEGSEYYYRYKMEIWYNIWPN